MASIENDGGQIVGMAISTLTSFFDSHSVGEVHNGSSIDV